MIDVIFLLLTFFVLTAKFREPEQILPILMGQSDAASAQVEPRTIPIRIGAVEGGCMVIVDDGTKISITEESPADGLLELTQCIQQVGTAGAGPIELYCEDAVSWNLVVKIYDVLYALGVQNITFRIDQ